jgi:penicillin-binding protein 1A
MGGLLLAFSFALACTYVYLDPALPTATDEVPMSVPLRVYSRSGGLVAQIGEERRIPVDFQDIPPLVRQAVLAAEDDRFFEHSGFEWRGIVRAMVMNVASAEAGQGGSTITQQAARNVFLTLDKTMRRKLSEVFLTWRMEQDFTKEEILATYLTVIYFGQRSYGIAAAAETYFGKRPEDLSVAQAATLAGIIQRPSAQNPITSPRLAEARRSYVLRRMTELGFIDQATADAAAKEPVASRGFAPLSDVEAPYVAELARQQLVERFGEGSVNEGYKVYTTLDDRLQNAATRALRLGLMEYDRPRGYRGHLGKVELAATMTDDELDAKLAEFSSVNILEPAIVTAVADTTAEVHLRGRGKARIAWDAMSWARKKVEGGTGPAPRKAADVVKRGDVVHVIADGRGNAQLAQVPEAQAAIAALDPIDGAIVSMVGGFEFFTNQYNRATQAQRQPGSGFKPILYSAALENGFTPATVILDAPIMRNDADAEEIWRPGNSGGDFLGPLPLREALLRSRNTVSVRILMEIGIGTLIDHAEKFGFDPKGLPRNDTLALGTQSTNALQMARAFAVFANGGFRVEPYFIERIEDATGKVVYQASPVIACGECEMPETRPAEQQQTVAMAQPFPLVEGGEEALALTVEDPDAAAAAAAQGSAPGIPALTDDDATSLSLAAMGAPRPLRGMEDVPESMRALASIQGGRGLLPEERLAPRAISAQNAWLMSDILHDAANRGTAQRTRALNRDDLAGKTGTTQKGRDNWFNGFTSNLVASVWVGFDNDQSLGAGAEGSTTAVPIWMHYMREALRGVPSSRPPRPDGLVDLRVSPSTGARAHPFDPTAITETFMLNHLPPAPRPGEAWEEPGAAGPASSNPF